MLFDRVVSHPFLRAAVNATWNSNRSYPCEKQAAGLDEMSPFLVDFQFSEIETNAGTLYSAPKNVSAAIRQ